MNDLRKSPITQGDNITYISTSCTDYYSNNGGKFIYTAYRTEGCN